MSFIQPPFWASVGYARVPEHAVSVVQTPGAPVFTIDQGKLRAGLDWVAGDARDALMTEWIAAAVEQVEKRTGLALPEQTRDVYFDAVCGRVITLPDRCRPLKSVSYIKTTDTAGVVNTLDPSNYVVDIASAPSLERPGPARIGLSVAGVWPTDLRDFQPWNIRVVVGWPVASLPPMLLRAVGLLVAHYATIGRDLATLGHVVNEMPQGFEDAIAGYETVSVV